MWSAATVDLGISNALFWRMTLRQFAALMERKRAIEQHADYRAGIVAALLANDQLGRSGNKDHRDPYGPGDFFPSLKTGEIKDAAQSHAERMKAKVMQLHSLFGGTLKTPSKQPTEN